MGGFLRKSRAMAMRCCCAAELPGIGLLAARQVQNLVVQVGLAGGGFDVGLGGGEVAVADVFFDGALSTMVFLEHQADFLAQGEGVVPGQRGASSRILPLLGRLDRMKGSRRWIICQRLI